MKIPKVILLLLSFSNIFSQNNVEFDKFPFDIETLQSLSYKKDTIMPKFIMDKFYYVNTKTNEKISNLGFEIAYPFVGRKSTIIKLNGKFGVIDKNGNLLVQPSYDSFQLWHTTFRENFVALGNNADNVFDLLNGKYVVPGNGCAKPYIERASLYGFKGKNNKYGINKIIDAKNYETIIKPVFDSIYLIKFSSIIARKKSRIGIVDEFNNLLLPFTYEDIIISKTKDFTIPNLIGLKSETVWEYYKLGIAPILILKSDYKCSNIGEIKNGFGIFNNNKKYNILFYDGSSMKKEYDWISYDGTIAIDENKVYILGEDAVPFLYYELQ